MAAERPNLKRLTASQLRVVLVAAQALRPSAREDFLRSVARTLANRELGDGAVDRAIRLNLTQFEGQRWTT